MTELVLPPVSAVARFVPTPVESYREAWLAGCASENTRRAYRSDFNVWFQFCSAYDLDPLNVRRVHVDAWARTLEAEGLALATRARRISTLASFYTYLVEEDVLAVSPVENVKRLKLSTEGTTPGLTRDETQRLLAAAEVAAERRQGKRAARNLALLALLAHTGLRVEEALSAVVGDIRHTRGHTVLRIERKGGKVGQTVITPATAHFLFAYLNGRSEGPLFATETGGRMHEPEVRELIRRHARAAGLEGWAELSPHSLRVAFITSAREAGVPLEDVQDAAGHADPRTTRRYDRGRHALDRHAAYAVAAYLSRASDMEDS